MASISYRRIWCTMAHALGFALILAVTALVSYPLMRSQAPADDRLLRAVFAAGVLIYRSRDATPAHWPLVAISVLIVVVAGCRCPPRWTDCVHTSCGRRDLAFGSIALVLGGEVSVSAKASLRARKAVVDTRVTPATPDRAQ